MIVRVGERLTHISRIRTVYVGAGPTVGHNSKTWCSATRRTRLNREFTCSSRLIGFRIWVHLPPTAKTK